MSWPLSENLPLGSCKLNELTLTKPDTGWVLKRSRRKEVAVAAAVDVISQLHLRPVWQRGRRGVVPGAPLGSLGASAPHPPPQPGLNRGTRAWGLTQAFPFFAIWSPSALHPGDKEGERVTDSLFQLLLEGAPGKAVPGCPVHFCRRHCSAAPPPHRCWFPGRRGAGATSSWEGSVPASKRGRSFLSSLLPPFPLPFPPSSLPSSTSFPSPSG